MRIITKLLARVTKHSKVVLGVVAGLVVGGAGSAAVLATIPGSNNVFHGCYRTSGNVANPKGSVRIIDNEIGETCTANEAAITWNQTGPQGPAGPAGPAGPQGPAGTSGGSLARTDLAGTDLTGIDFIVKDLRNVDFSNAKVGAAWGYSDITGATFIGTDFSGSSITFMDFSGHNLQDMKLDAGGIVNSTFNQTNLSNAEMDTSDNSGNPFIKDSEFQGANFSNAKFGAALTRVDLSGANFSNAIFDVDPASFVSFIDIQESNLTNVNFSGAQFTTRPSMTIFIQNSDLTGSDMSGLNVSRVDWVNSTCPDGTNSDANGDTCVGHLTP
jgi:uncharacterized protein YjbI with pentapeptide repeats